MRHRYSTVLIVASLGAILSSATATTVSLSPKFNSGDGVYTTSTLGGRTVWQPAAGSSYLYFDVPASFPFVTGSPVYVKVTYFDAASGSVKVQYDSQTNAYKSSEIHTRSSAVGTGAFVASYHQLADSRFTGRENGAADFRINGYPPIDEVLLQDTPFAIPLFSWPSPSRGSHLTWDQLALTWIPRR
jgi:hypothetical protein